MQPPVFPAGFRPANPCSEFLCQARYHDVTSSSRRMPYARVAKSVDARDLKSLGRKAMRVRPPPRAPATARQQKARRWRAFCRAAVTAAMQWRPRSESNRRTRICSPLHDHSATRPLLDARDHRDTEMIAYSPENKTPAIRGSVQILERETRLELATPTLARSCSTN